MFIKKEQLQKCALAAFVEEKTLLLLLLLLLLHDLEKAWLINSAALEAVISSFLHFMSALALSPIVQFPLLTTRPWSA